MGGGTLFELLGEDSGLEAMEEVGEAGGDVLGGMKSPSSSAGRPLVELFESSMRTLLRRGPELYGWSGFFTFEATSFQNQGSS